MADDIRRYAIKDGNINYLVQHIDKIGLDFLCEKVKSKDLHSVNGIPLDPECVKFITERYLDGVHPIDLFYSKVESYLVLYHYKTGARKETPAEIFAGEVVYSHPEYSLILLDGNFPKRYGFNGWTVDFLIKAIEDGALKTIYGVPVPDNLKKVMLNCTNRDELVTRISLRFRRN